MEDSKLFRHIWRFNAVIIALTGILGVVLTMSSLFFLFKELNRSRHRNGVANIDSSTNIEESFRFGKIIHIAGSSSFIIPLHSDQNFSLGSSVSKSTASTRNFLFTNVKNESSNWLLPNNQYLITDHNLVRPSDFSNRNEDVVTILYQVVKSDTN